MSESGASDILEIRDARGRVSRVALASARVVLGRAEDANARLDHVAVSRHHAELVPDPFGRWWLRDLKSHNGTRVNGVAVTDRVLGYEDVVEIGPFRLRLRPSAYLATTQSMSTTTAQAVCRKDSRIARRWESSLSSKAAEAMSVSQKILAVSARVDGVRRWMIVRKARARL